MHDVSDKLEEEFPALYSNALEIWVGMGWYSTLRDLSMKLPHDGSVKVYQVKEKFGGLRFYLKSAQVSDSALKDIRKAIKEAEDKCWDLCERCGSDASLMISGGWVKTMCNDCATSSDAEWEAYSHDS